MADVFLTSPRRQAVQIKLHAGELSSIVCQEGMLKEFTTEELRRMIDHLSTEDNYRENNNVSSDSTV